MNHPVVIGAVVGAVLGVLVALVVRLRAGQWRLGTGLAIGIIIGVVTAVTAIWYGWAACVFGICGGYMLGVTALRDAPDENQARQSQETHDNAA